MNTVEYRETTKERTVKAVFTDNVGESLTKTLSYMLAFRVGQGRNERGSAVPLLSLPVITSAVNGQGRPDLSPNEGIDIGEPKARKRRRKRPKKEASAQAPEKQQTQAIDVDKQPRPRARGSSDRPSPTVILDNLIAEQFFKEWRAVSAIIDDCREKLACSYKSTDLSVPLMRAVRSKKLERKKNSDGQFEYFK